ncbi:MAG TPA: chemotaxis protein CheW [Geminicoccus sp.]|jgi:purine-binding chemotaxis protein CheW|uniref:chemotaxis protein CheW n=1 Tax=Geminicoccus sp. TaxID=2024832 RepID=UPI002E2F11D6|nr:chemotaxis protein CheW [Geminicoccus sp.]HEX2529792.1 chemotaxis protein CheW [Geminicoccus sp.]
MNSSIAEPKSSRRPQAAAEELVSMHVGGQLVGIPVRIVQDILGFQRITRVPLAAREIAGVLNLRGRIVTAIDLRQRLGMDAVVSDRPSMSVVCEHGGELYSLLIDQIGEVLQPPADRFDTDLTPLTQCWREFSRGIYRLDNQLLVLLDVGRVLAFN